MTRMSDNAAVISIHALREEGDRPQIFLLRRIRHFYPRPPRGGRHTDVTIEQQGKIISIHALREEGDKSLGGVCSVYQDFYPRPPRGGRLPPLEPPQLYTKFLSTPSARRATPSRTSVRRWLWISIHALREEGDSMRWTSTRRPANFYPRPPRGGRHELQLRPTSHDYFYPRPPRGGRLHSAR